MCKDIKIEKIDLNQLSRFLSFFFLLIVVVVSLFFLVMVEGISSPRYIQMATDLIQNTQFSTFLENLPLSIAIVFALIIKAFVKYLTVLFLAWMFNLSAKYSGGIIFKLAKDSDN